MPIIMNCENPDCRKPLRVKDELVGKPVRCPHCRQITKGTLLPPTQSDALVPIPNLRAIIPPSEKESKPETSSIPAPMPDPRDNEPSEKLSIARRFAKAFVVLLMLMAGFSVLANSLIFISEMLRVNRVSEGGPLGRQLNKTINRTELYASGMGALFSLLVAGICWALSKKIQGNIKPRPQSTRWGLIGVAVLVMAGVLGFALFTRSSKNQTIPEPTTAGSEFLPEPAPSNEGEKVGSLFIGIGVDNERTGEVEIFAPEKTDKICRIADQLDLSQAKDRENLVRGFVDTFGKAEATWRGILFSDRNGTAYRWPKDATRNKLLTDYPLAIGWEKQVTKAVNIASLPAIVYNKSPTAKFDKIDWQFTIYVQDQNKKRYKQTIQGWTGRGKADESWEILIPSQSGTISLSDDRWVKSIESLMKFNLRNISNVGDLRVAFFENKNNNETQRKQLSKWLSIPITIE